MSDIIDSVVVGAAESAVAATITACVAICIHVGHRVTKLLDDMDAAHTKLRDHERKIAAILKALKVEK
jgi:hypothetical protein